MKLPEIIYEDENVFVFNKPAGLMVHDDGRGKEETLADLILKKYPEMKNVGEPLYVKHKDGSEKPVYRPGIVHRLDKDTTGAILVAKNEKAFQDLKNQFKERAVEKKYLAVVAGHVKKNHDFIDRPIGRSSTDFRKWSATRGARGKERAAVTEYRVLKRFLDKNKEPFTLLEVNPKTGRTHQLRVHLKAVNHPIIGDSLYAPRHASALGFKRPALHAHELSFSSLSGKKISVKAETPEDIAKIAKGVVK